MAVAEMQMQIKVSIAWWLRWYVAGVALMAVMTRLQPNEARVGFWIDRGVRIEAEPVRSVKNAPKWGEGGVKGQNRP